jgi:hypothetical protein
MCGRSTYKLTWEEIVELYRLTLDVPPDNLRPRFAGMLAAFSLARWFWRS